MFSRVLLWPAGNPPTGTRLISAGLVAVTAATLLTTSVYRPDRPAPRGTPAVQAEGAPAVGAPVPVKAREADPAAAAAVTGPATVDWPAGSGELSLGGQLRLGGLTVTAQPAAEQFVPPEGRFVPAAAEGRGGSGRVRVEVLDREASTAAGVDGPVLRLAGPTKITRVTFGYRDFMHAYGGDWGARLRLVGLPDCAVGARAGAGDCPEPEALPVTNDNEKHTVTADLRLAPARYFALLADEDSAQGDFSASTASPSSAWEVAPSTGAVSWTYPIRVPPVPGGRVPAIELEYSSQAIDGRTAATNNQGSAFGDGFTYEPGYIERRYKSCSDDGHKDSADQCWGRHNASLVLNGRSSELVRVNDNEWKLSTDDGSRVERLAGATNGDSDGEHWKVTTTDGTQYFLGLNRLPGWSSGKDETGSVWTVPVYGDDSGEPCWKATFAEAWCDQAWRWNLDYVKDLHGNVIAYHYDRETNHYARGGRTDVDGTAYHRGGYLKRIDYGLRDNAYTAPAPARVHFVTAERCLPAGTVDCDPADLTKDTAASWPDVPFDRNCNPNSKCGIQQKAPTFWTRKRYTEIRTEIRSGGGWSPVDAWKLTHQFNDNSDGSRTLWLRTIQHVGLVGGTTELPPIELHGIQLPNRVDQPTDMIGPLIRFRLAAVYTDTGAQLDVDYADADCAAGNLPTAGESTRRCYPVKWHPSDSLTEPITDWFHKYVVRQVVQTDRTARSPDMVTRYEYLGGAGWRKVLPDGLTEDKYRTWADWRGYGKVRVTRGDGQSMPVRTEHTFFQGLDGDERVGGGTRTSTVTDSTGTVHPDAPELTGSELETVTYDGDAVVSRTINVPWRHTSYTQTEGWGTRRSTFVQAGTVRGFTALEAGGWRETRIVNRYETAFGRIVEAENLGDVATAADDRCTRTEYAENAGLRLMQSVRRVESVSVACGVTPDRRVHVVGDERTSFDGLAWGATPTKAAITKVERIAAHNGTTATYQTVLERTIDDWGREATVKDALGNVSTTAYTHTDGLVTAVRKTDVLRHSSIEYLAPAWGEVVAGEDANGERTDMVYDPLGRRWQVWLADRSKAGGATPNLKYTYVNRADAIVAVKTETVRNDGGYTVRWDLFDGHTRTRQTQIEGPNGGRVLTDTFYTGTGKTAKTNTAYHATGVPADALLAVNDGAVDGQTVNVYDGADRLVAEIGAVAGNEKWRTVTRYGGDRVHVDPPTGAVPTTTVLDVNNQPLEMRQYKGAGPSGDHDRVVYTYTPGGKPATATDAGGRVWRSSYDLRGRLTKTEDPNTGTTEYGYDDLDRRTWSVDARGSKISTQWDAAGRKIKEFAGDPQTGTLLRSWSWDVVYKGQLYAAASYVDGHAYGTVYPLRDELYRPLLTRYVIPSHAGIELAGVYEFTTAYNRDGSVRGMGYPNAGGLPAEGVTYSHDALRQPVRLTGSTTYVTNAVYAQTGQLLQTELSTGAKKTWLTWTYEEGTNRLLRTRVEHQDAPTTDLDATYRYDAAGNVLSIVDDPAGGSRDAQCFTLDWQRRLTVAWTSASTATDPCAGGPAATGVGGPAPYHQTFGYDASGNRTMETRAGPDGSMDTTRTYRYPGAGEARRSAVSRVEEDGPAGDRVSAYTYDGAGNTTVRELPGRRQTLDWNADGRLAAVTEGGSSTTFVYGADGVRLVRKEIGATTVYLPGMELRLNHANRAVAGTRYYLFGGRTVALRTTAGVMFLGADHQNTITVSVDAVTGAVQRRRTTPFGEARGAVSGWPTDRGFVGGITDATGLIHLGAREYDPTTGRFISVDPVVDPGSPQQLQGYSYANNSPVTLADPDGRKPCPDGDCSQAAAAGGNQSWAHNIVVAIMAFVITQMMRARGIKGRVTIDKKSNYIPGGHRDGNGRDGYADIIFWADDKSVVYVWEVKPADKASREMGRQQVDRYVEQLQKKLNAEAKPGEKVPEVKLGPPMPTIGNVPLGNGTTVRMWSEAGQPGLIFYHTTSAPPPNAPPPVTVPVPNPTPVPVPVPGNGPQRVPDTAPTTPPTGSCGHPACPTPNPPGGGRGGVHPGVIIWGVAIVTIAAICIFATAGACGVVIVGGVVVGGATA